MPTDTGYTAITKTAIGYKSYLLRLWQAQPPDAACRAMLECISDPHERHYFSDLESLMAFLLSR